MDLNAQTKEEYFASMTEKERTQAPHPKHNAYTESDHEKLYNIAKVITWVLCFIGVITGIVLIRDGQKGLGWGIILLSIVQVVFSLIFIHLAEDINAIRNSPRKW